MARRIWLAIVACLVVGLLAVSALVYVAFDRALHPRSERVGSILWERCLGKTRFGCATLSVPVDYSNPGGRRIDIALNRLPARNRDAWIGALVTNPGGPGGSGLDFLFNSVDDLKALGERFDLIGFDPRGVGASHPVRCLNGSAVDEFLVRQS